MLERNPLPRYAQVADALRNRIRRGAWKRREAIPTIDRLMAEFGVGRVTVRQAIQILAREGLLSPEQGRGTFVTAEPGSLRRAAGPDLARRPRRRCTAATRPTSSISSRPTRRRGFGGRAGGRRSATGTCAGAFARRGSATASSPSTSPGRSSTSPRSASAASWSSRSCSTCRAWRSTAPDQTLDIAAADVDVARSLGVAVNAPIAEVRCVFVGADDTVLYVAEASHRGDYVHLKMDLLPAGAPQ